MIGELFARLKGGPCRTYSSNQRVKVDRTELYTYPDVVVVSGPGEYDPADEDTLNNPTAIIEVLSPSTEQYDRGAKLRHYQKLPSLREYVMASEDEMLVERFIRQPDGSWVLTSFADPAGEFQLACAGVRVPLADVYRDVELPPAPPKPAGPKS